MHVSVCGASAKTVLVLKSRRIVPSEALARNLQQSSPFKDIASLPVLRAHINRSTQEILRPDAVF